MCGIAGLLHFNNKPIDSSLLKRMGDSIYHRGPEAEGIYNKDGVGLVHRRLKIIDLASGDQPLFSKDKKVVCIFNGEIYNYEELRSSLSKEGYEFSTKSDTEVLVALYLKTRNLDFLHKLNGMFVFVIHDHETSTTWIARDRTGEKPLYTFHKGGVFAFSSEIQGLTTLPYVSRDMDLGGLENYIHYGYIPTPFSIYSDIGKMKPGTYYQIKDDVVNEREYWHIPLPEKKSELSFDECFEKFEKLLSEAVKLRMVSDVPLGAFLSGGVDSSTVAALMKEHSNNKVKTFTIGFKDSSYNESENAERVSKILGTEHHTELLDGFDVGLIPTILKHFGEPYADSSAIPTYYLSKATKSHVTVALSGDGADELIGGYSRYVAAEKTKNYVKLPYLMRPDFLFQYYELLSDGHGYYGKSQFKKVKMLLRFLSENYSNEANLAPFIFGDRQRPQLFSKDIQAKLNEKKLSDPVVEYSKFYSKLSFTERMLWTDFHTYMPDDIHVKVDRMSMAHALEVRTPFMDHHLIEFLTSISLEYKISGGKTKIILRKLMEKYLGKESDRPKHGFVAPVSHWINHELKNEIRSLFESKAAAQYFNTTYLKSLLTAHANGKDLSSEIWTIYAFLLWHERIV